MLPASSALMAAPRLGGVLQPVQAGPQQQQAPDCDARITALCKASSNALDSEATVAIELQNQTDALRAECAQLAERAAALRAEMASLVVEVDSLGAADKRAEVELREAKVEYDKHVQEHQLLLAKELHLEADESRLEEAFEAKLEQLEDKMNAAHAQLEVVLTQYSSAEAKAGRKQERVVVEKKSLELERVQEQIDQAKRRKLCMQIAEAEIALAKAKAATA